MVSLNKDSTFNDLMLQLGKLGGALINKTMHQKMARCEQTGNLCFNVQEMFQRLRKIGKLG